MDTLIPIGPDRFDPEAMPVAALVHNERNIVGAFLDHYRAICRPTFVIVDDRSTDGTREFLLEQPDVTLLSPRDRSTYGADKAAWRGEPLDRYCAGRWAIVPDIDEHLIFPRMEERSLDAYIAALESEGAEAVVTLMIDMYADEPLADHVFEPDVEPSLVQRFPLFDGQGPLPHGYMLRRVRRDRAYPTPPVRQSGGMQDRLFAQPFAGLPTWRLRLLDRFSGPDQPIHPGALRRLGQRLAERRLPKGPNRTKLGLVKWRAGMRFGGGAHRLDTEIPVSESIAAFLHFVFTRGRAGLEYYVARGQHTNGAEGYQSVLDNRAAMENSPAIASSRRYEGSRSLDGMIRDVPADRRP